MISESAGNQRSIAMRIYVPSTPRVIQKPVNPFTESKEPRTIGSALHELLPELFRSSRLSVQALLAQPVVHGVIVQMSTPLAELVQVAAYPDGFLHVTLNFGAS